MMTTEHRPRFPFSLPRFLLAGIVVMPLCFGQSEESGFPLVHRVPVAEFQIPDSDALSVKLQEEDEKVSIISGRIRESLSIDLGSFPVQPGTVYRAEVQVESGKLQGDAGVSLMIREHSEVGAAPFKPYLRTQLSARPLANNTTGSRILNFVTGEETRALSAVVVVTKLAGELQISPFDLSLGTPTGKPLTPEEVGAKFEKVMFEFRKQADAREPLTPRPLVFSRSQMKYPLGRPYYHEWNDRPLLVDRKYRVESGYPTPLSSYERTLEEVRKYDIDGLAFFPETTRRTRMFEAHKKATSHGLGLLPEFIPTNHPEAIAEKIEILKIALAHPDVPRIHGKVLVTSYAAESLSPEQWSTMLTELREAVGDTFLFLPTVATVAQLRKPFMDGDLITGADIERLKAVLRKYLDVCDGIYFNYPAAFKLKDHSFDVEFYRDVFIPVFKSVLSEPAYQKKYLGLSAYRSHMSPERGNSLHEDGTRTLRLSFEAAMNARPDVIILPEWDEQNENTSFRPTLYGSRTSERIIRHYMSQIKNQEPTPVPGDDLEIPNLILSSRKGVALGERAMFELLNVPDSVEKGSYSVVLKLEDSNGGLVHSFPEVKFDSARLQEHRFSLPTESLPDVVALVPTLSIRDFKGRGIKIQDGFHHVAVRATWNWDHLFVKQPLRDLLQPDKVTFEWDESEVAAGDSRVLNGVVVSPEELTLVEVLGDDDEVYAVDSTDEFFRNDPTKERLLIEFRSINNLRIKGQLTLKNARAEWFSNGPPLQHLETAPESHSQRISLDRPSSVHQRWIYLAVPKNDLEKGELLFEIDSADAFTVSLREVFEKKMVGRGLDGGVHLSVKPYRRQIDMPHSLNTLETKFSARVWPEIATEQFHLRLTTVSGKTFRSRPLLLPSPEPVKKEKRLRVFSDTKQKPVDVLVREHRIPSLHYEFDPARGAVLLTDAGEPFGGTLGGFSNSTTGRGTVNGLFGDEYPSPVKRSDPAWGKDEEGRACLEFDGVGTYLELPREAIPWRGAFTLEFDVNPESGEDQYLFINGTVTHQYGLAMKIENGKLHASFLDADWESHRWQTRLPVPPEAWSSIRVRADFDKITFTVDGESESFPLTRPAFNIGFTVFGANWKGTPFTGRLRGLKIVHNSW